MNHSNVAGSFSQKVISLTVTCYFIGMEQFKGHQLQQALAAIFCHALRFTLLNELEDRAQTSAEVLKEVLDCLEPGTPQKAVDAFKRLAPNEFEEWYKRIRAMAGKEGVDIGELANALSCAQEIARNVAKSKGVGSQ